MRNISIKMRIVLAVAILEIFGIIGCYFGASSTGSLYKKSDQVISRASVYAQTTLTVCAQNAEAAIGQLKEEAGKQYRSDSEYIAEVMKNFLKNALELNENVTRMSDSMNQITHEVEESTEGISRTAEEASKLAGIFSDITDMAQDNKNMAMEMKNSVKMFIVQEQNKK